MVRWARRPGLAVTRDAIERGRARRNPRCFQRSPSARSASASSKCRAAVGGARTARNRAAIGSQPRNAQRTMCGVPRSTPSGSLACASGATAETDTDTRSSPERACRAFRTGRLLLGERSARSSPATTVGRRRIHAKAEASHAIRSKREHKAHSVVRTAEKQRPHRPARPQLGERAVARWTSRSAPCTRRPRPGPFACACLSGAQQRLYVFEADFGGFGCDRVRGGLVGAVEDPA